MRVENSHVLNEKMHITKNNMYFIYNPAGLARLIYQAFTHILQLCIILLGLVLSENHTFCTFANICIVTNTHYRSGMVNSKSFIGKVFLQIKWKFELN